MAHPVDLAKRVATEHCQAELSAELKKFLEESTVVGEPGPKSEETWKAIRVLYEEATLSLSDAAKGKYIESVSEESIADIPVLHIKPKGAIPAHDGKKIIYIHGGTFTLGSAKHLYHVFAPIAHETGLEVVAIEYSRAPEAVFPQAITECTHVYRALAEKYGGENLVLLGNSAGGNLCLATALKAKEEDIPLPKALALFSPVTSAHKGESYEKNKDPRITYEASIEPAFTAYCDDKDEPLFTIVNADLSGLPPIFTQTGSRDALESDSTELVEKVRAAGGAIRLLRLEGVPHGIVEQSEDIPESRMAREGASSFIKTHFGMV